MSKWYLDYCKEHHIPIRYGKDAQRHEQTLRRLTNKASKLEDVDISGLSRQEAEKKLRDKSEEMVVGMTGISLLLLKAIISWIINKLIDRAFNASDRNS